MAHVRPEHLLEPRDYRQWVKTQSSSDRPDGEPNAAAAVDDNVFESLSKRAWMDVLLQLIKVGISLRFDCAIFPPRPSSSAPVKPRMETFWYRLTQAVLENGR